MIWGKKHDIALHVAMLVSLLLLVYMSVFYVSLPYGVPGWHAPGTFRVFFYHIPLAWTAYLSFGVVFVASIIYLRTKKMLWDMVAGSSAEVGVLLTTLALITGAIWRKAEQGDYWSWEDTKLFTTFILWMSYIAYLALRAGVKGGSRPRIAAVFGIISFVFVPISYFASRSAASLHEVTPSYFPRQNVITLIVGVIAMTLLFASILRYRLGIEKLKAQLEVVKEEMEELH